jgi:hypothetical protein
MKEKSEDFFNGPPLFRHRTFIPPAKDTTNQHSIKDLGSPPKWSSTEVETGGQVFPL